MLVMLHKPRRHARSCQLAALAVLILGGVAVAGEIDVSVRDGAGKPLANAVVYAESLAGPARPAAQMAPVTIDQVDREFVPSVTVIRVPVP